MCCNNVQLYIFNCFIFSYTAYPFVWRKSVSTKLIHSSSFKTHKTTLRQLNLIHSSSFKTHKTTLSQLNLIHSSSFKTTISQLNLIHSSSFNTTLSQLNLIQNSPFKMTHSQPTEPHSQFIVQDSQEDS